MLRSALWTVAAAGLLGLGACTSLPPDQVEAIGTPYNEQVKEAYLELSERGPNKPLFYDKAIAAFQGDKVWPEPVANWNLDPEFRLQAHVLRERLVTLLEAGADEAAPGAAAEAIAGFDCWMQYEERVFDGVVGPDPGCRDAFLTALPKLEASVVDVPPAYLVYFLPGQSELGLLNLAVVEDAARMAKLAGAESIEVVGFADRSGSSQANERLSNERADAVAQALVGMGIPPQVVQTSGEGSVASGDAAENRRVEIRLRV